MVFRMLHIYSCNLRSKTRGSCPGGVCFSAILHTMYAGELFPSPLLFASIRRAFGDTLDKFRNRVSHLSSQLFSVSFLSGSSLPGNFVMIRRIYGKICKIAYLRLYCSHFAASAADSRQCRLTAIASFCLRIALPVAAEQCRSCDGTIPSGQFRYRIRCRLRRTSRHCGHCPSGMDEIKKEQPEGCSLRIMELLRA